MISVQTDVTIAEKALQGTKKSLPGIQKQITGMIARKTKNKIVSAARHDLDGNGIIAHKYEYSIADAYSMKSHGTYATVFAKRYEAGRANDISLPVISALSYGRTFPTVIKGRGFVQEGIRYAEGDHSEEIEKVIQKELDKYWS